MLSARLRTFEAALYKFAHYITLHSNSIQPAAKWGAGGDNIATRHYFYCVMRGSCKGIDYDYVIDVVAGSKLVSNGR